MPRAAPRHQAASRDAAGLSGHVSRSALALIGFMGSGKSVVGAMVADRASAPFFDLDFMIESEAGMTIPQIFSNRGEAVFRELESRLLPSALRSGSVVALGGGTAMDDANWELIGNQATSIYLEVPFETIWQRIGRSENRPLVAGRLRKEVESLFERRRPRYEQSTHRVNADRSPDDVASDVLALWCD